jgi:hypothetical protein
MNNEIITKNFAIKSVGFYEQVLAITDKNFQLSFSNLKNSPKVKIPYVDIPLNHVSDSYL